jgi:hypothetical protein
MCSADTIRSPASLFTHRVPCPIALSSTSPPSLWMRLATARRSIIALSPLLCLRTTARHAGSYTQLPNETVDVAALDLGQEKVVKVWTINDACTSQDFDDFELRPGLDVFVIGFPLGLRVAEHLAIWKRGTIASEPMFDVEGKPIILIDTATRSVMSGAPVIAQITGMWLPRGQADLGKARFGIGRSFLGIYSGRLGQDEFKAQLGIVWKKQVIDEIVLQGRMLDIKTASEAIPGDSDSFAATE